MTTPPLQLSDATGVPYYRQIVDQLAQLIRSGQLPPGEQLPSVRELATQLLVSLITTRRAYADLEAMGLLVRRQGTGTFVAEEVEVASHEQALKDTEHRIAEAIGHGRRVGLDDRELTALWQRCLHGRSDDDRS